MAESIPGSFNILEWAQRVLPKREYGRLVAETQKPLSTSIRANRLKVNPETAIMDWVDWYGWTTERVPFCPSGYWLPEVKDPPGTTISHRMGYFYIQEAASMLPAELFDLSKEENPIILDMAASPGGKTTHLADRTGDKGLIIANDASRSRIPALQIVLRNWGAINQAVTCLPGESFGMSYPSFFDAVLLDAPCSMQGMRSLDTHSMRPVSESELNTLASRQKRLLESALRTVKPGGQVVYATCTLTPQENEGVLADVISRFPRQVAIQNAHSILPDAAMGLDELDGAKLPLSIRYALRIWPHILHTAGFFTAILVKEDELPYAGYRESFKATPTQQRYRALNQSQSKSVFSSFSDQYGFELEHILKDQSIKIYEINEQLYLIPSIIQERMENLPWISCGIQLGKKVQEGCLPSHEFVARFGDQFQKKVLVLEDQYVDAWLRGEDIRKFQTDLETIGSILVIRDALGRNLGRAKLISDRLKNLLPTRLF